MTDRVAVRGTALRKSYEQAGSRLDVLRGVDLEIAEGEFVSVMGPSGSGKSTLLHLLGGLDVADAGEVEIGGSPLSGLSDDERTRLRADRIGVVYQFFNLVPVLTAAENIALPAVIAGSKPSEHRSRTTELLALVGLASEGDKLPSQLSGGQQQRVAIARALFAEPALVLADEPTGNLDMETGAEILALFVRAREELGQSLLMVTHDPRSAACGDRVLLLRDGVVSRELDLRNHDPNPAVRTAAVLSLLSANSVAPDSVAPNGAGLTPPTSSDGVRRPRRRRAPLQAGS